MAPEVAVKKVYSKVNILPLNAAQSVDVFSCGIIMHVLLTGGDHPLYSAQDSPQCYKKKLNDLAHSVNFPSALTGLSRNLYSRLTKFQSVKRYTATEALGHPWITRRHDTSIPLTVPERMNNMELEGKLKQVLNESLNKI